MQITIRKQSIVKSNGTDQRVTEIETLKRKDLVKDMEKTENEKTLHSSGRRS